MTKNYSQLKVTKHSRRKWEVIEDWITPFGVVPKGFVSNAASVPRLLWSAASPAGILFEAAILHDFLYCYGIQTKKFADKAFRATASHFKAKDFEAYLAYTAVKWWGKGNY